MIVRPIEATAIPHTYIEQMNTVKIRSVISALFIASAILGGSAACAAKTEVQLLASCLDNAGVAYRIENGAVVVTQYADKGSEETRDAAEACMGIADD